MSSRKNRDHSQRGSDRAGQGILGAFFGSVGVCTLFYVGVSEPVVHGALTNPAEYEAKQLLLAMFGLGMFALSVWLLGRN